MGFDGEALRLVGAGRPVASRKTVTAPIGANSYALAA